MDWERVTARQREALARFVAMLCALLGIRPGESVGRVPKATYWAALALLKPLESAVRRLVTIRTRGMDRPEEWRARPGPVAIRQGAGQIRPRPPRFQLWDRRKQFEPPKFANPRCPPRITLLGVDAWSPYPRRATPGRDAPRDAAPLARRLWALDLALADPEAQARRLLRWMARREAMRADGRKAKFTVPLRPGNPPGYRRRRQREIDRILGDLDLLARMAVRQANLARGTAV